MASSGGSIAVRAHEDLVEPWPQTCRTLRQQGFRAEVVRRSAARQASWSLNGP